MNTLILAIVILSSILILLCLCILSLIGIFIVYRIISRRQSSSSSSSYRFGYVHEERQNLLNERTTPTRYNKEYQRENRQMAQKDLTSEEMLGIKTALRSTPFKLVKEIGRFPGKGEKVFVLCNDQRNSTKYLMTILQRHTKTYTAPHHALIQTEDEKITFVRLMKNLSSRYLMPTRDCFFTTQTQKCIMFRDFMKNGSIKDLIHGVNAPLELDYNDKYYGKDQIYSRSSKGGKSRNAQNEMPLKEGVRPLKKWQCTQFGRQILLGLQSLQKIGLRFPHLSTTNVLVVNRDECLLTEFENIFLDHPRTYAAYITPEQKSMPEELIAFGHMLFEMATGHELNDHAFPGVLTKFSVWPDLEDVLKMILAPSASSSQINIDDLLSHSFFTTSSNLDYDTAPALPKVTGRMKKLIEKVDAFIQDPLVRTASRTMSASRESYSKNMSNSLSRSWGSFKSNNHLDNLESEGILSKTSSPQSTTATPQVQSSPAPVAQKSSAPPPRAPPPPPPASAIPVEKVPPGRGALLADIRSGARLRKVPDSEKKHRDTAK